MVIKLNVQYDGGFLPNILLLTQASIVVRFDGIIVVTTFLIVYQVLCCLFVLLCLVARHGDECISVSV